MGELGERGYLLCRPPTYSSNRNPPKSHAAVKKTTSKQTSTTIGARGKSDGSARSPTVAPTLAISSGTSAGKSSKGKSNSRMRACDAIAAKTVPTVAMPNVPRSITPASGPLTPSNGTSYSTENAGSRMTSTSTRKKKFAKSFPAMIAKGSTGASTRAAIVSLVRSRVNEGCSISELAKSSAIQRKPAPNRRESAADGLNAKLKTKTTTSAKTIVEVSSSNERNSTRSSFENTANVARERPTYLARGFTERYPRYRRLERLRVR